MKNAMEPGAAPPLLCSIIIPTYNRAGFVATAIDSVLNQMIPGDELIVVDDGSEDETPRILACYGSRITVVQGGHGGAGRARNLGIDRARNDLVAFLDSDDRWFPHKLRIQRAFMERRPEALFSFTNFEVEYRDGSVRPRYLELWPRDHATWEEAFGPGYPYSTVVPLPEGIADFLAYEGDLYRLQLTGFYVLTDTLMVRRKEAGDALHFAEDLKTYEDLECFYRLSQRGKAAFLDVNTVRQLDHPHGRLSQRDNLEKIDARLVLMRRIWGWDANFLQRYSVLYRRSLDDLLLQKAGRLISQGQSRQARMTLAEMSSAPPLIRLLSYLPASLTKPGLQSYRAIKNVLSAFLALIDKATKKSNTEKRSMKIFFLSHWAGSGGAEKVLYKTISILKKNGAGIVCAVPCKGSFYNNIKELNVRCYLIPYRWWMGKNIALYKRIGRNVLNIFLAIIIAVLIKKEKCQIVYSNTSTIHVGALAAWLARKPHIWHIHEYGYEHGGMTFDLGITISTKLMDKLSTVIITVSEGIKNKYAKYIDKNKFRTLYNYIEMPGKVEEEPRSDFASFRIVIVGSLHEGKGQDEALFGVHRLVQEGVKCELVIVGDGEDEEYKEKLKSIVSSCRLEQNVQFRGQLKDPFGVIKSADCVLMCSRYEGFSLVIIEAMLLQKIVVAANSGSVSELVKNYYNGLTYEAGNYEDLASKMRYVYLNKTAADIIAYTALNWARKRFTKENFCSQLTDILTRLT